MKKLEIMKLLKKNKSWHVVKDESRIKVYKEFGQKRPLVITFSLKYSKTGFIIEHPHYGFKSTVSHFAPVREDKRMTLNKAFLKSIIRSLKEIGVWENIINKDFLKVNEGNPRSDKELVKKELTELLG